MAVGIFRLAVSGPLRPLLSLCYETLEVLPQQQSYFVRERKT